MNAFRNLVKQLSAIWTQAGPAQRAALAAAGVLLGAAIIGVGIWSARPQYVMLASTLSPSEAAALGSRLESQGIKYRLSHTGSTVEVSKGDLAKARLAASELIAPGDVAPGPLDGSIMSDPSLNSHKIEKRLETSLASTIKKFRGVSSATVHIGRPQSSPFISERQDVTASVVLELEKNGGFSRSQANSVVMTVANAVEGLSTENVTVIDTFGRALSAEGGVGADIAGQLEYRQRVEASLASNAELMLSQLLGYGHAVVRVTADVDFTGARRIKRGIDPDSKVRFHETIMSQEGNGAERPSGPVGAGPNAGSGGQTVTKSDGKFSVEQSTSQYAVGTTEDEVNEAAGTIKRLTVAAVVDLSPLKTQEDAPEITEEQLAGIIKQAVGFDPSQQDEIELLLAPLATAPSNEPAIPLAPWSQYEVLVRNASLGIGGIAALILGLMILKKIQPPVTSAKTPSLDARVARALANMSETVRRNPDQLKDALRLWLTEEEGDQRRETTEARAEAAEAA